jgi:signal recognition particle subunit SRP54
LRPAESSILLKTVFAHLSEKLSKALRDLRGLSKLTEENIAPALNEVRSALMSADVNFKVAKDFTEKVKTTCLGTAVVDSVSPGQMAVKVISDELTRLLGEGERPVNPVRPLRVLLVGLQGSGKTTSAAKLAKHLVKKEGLRKPSLIAADLRRPAAIDQLETLAKQEGFDFRADRGAKNVAEMVGRLVHEAESSGSDAVIVDTAGRLQIDADLMEEIRQVREVLQPHEVFLVADAALGQQAVDVATQFHATTPLTGIILTKLDGDARGGAALSMKAVTGVPIRYIGTGEKSGDFDTFYPDRMSQRILGMGDVVSLVEKAKEVVDQKEAERLAEKMRKADFDLEDFLAQMAQMKKMGPLGDIMKMMPGMGNVQVGAREEKMLGKTEAIILSMTLKERRKPDILNASRRARIAKGSGTQVSDVNALIKQFTQMREMMRMMKGGKGKELMRRMGQMGGGRGGFPGGGFPGGFR